VESLTSEDDEKVEQKPKIEPKITNLVSSDSGKNGENKPTGTITPPPLLSPVTCPPTKRAASSTAVESKKENVKSLAKKLKCPACPEEFGESDLLEIIKHIRCSHGNNELTRWRIGTHGVMPLKCTYCEYSFKTQKVLEKHRTER